MITYTLEIIKSEFEKVKTAWNILSELRTTSEIMGIGIDGKTTRVLSTKQKSSDKPERISQVVIKKWVKAHFNPMISLDKDFHELHGGLVEDMETMFKQLPKPVRYTKLKREVPWSVCAKILDLILLYGINHDSNARQFFHVNGNLPLDSFTLKAAKKLFSDFDFTYPENVHDFFNKSKNLSMGSISNYCNYDTEKEKLLYNEIQLEVERFITTEIQISDFYPYHFDRWAWQNELLLDKV